MVKETKKNTSNKYKAVNPDQFKEWYGDDTSVKKALCKGEAVSVKANDRAFKDWINNKIIVKG